MSDSSITIRLGVNGTAQVEEAIKKIGETTRRQFDDASKSVGLARHEMINLGRQASDIAVSLAGGQSPLMVLMQQGTQVADILGTHQGGVGAALKSLGENILGLLTPGRLVAAGLGAAFAAIESQISKASAELTNLGRAQAATGLEPSRILAARGVGAGAGLDRKEVQGALEYANREFERFQLHSGEVKKALEEIDGRFVILGERAKTTGEFIDFVQERIKELPRVEGLDLARKLFGEDAGAKLFEAIRNGELAMKALDEAAQKTGVSFADGPAKAALDLQHQIDKAAEDADQKLFAAFGRLSDPLRSVSLLWQEIKGYIADSVIAAEHLYEAIRDGGKMARPVPGAQGRSIDQYMADNNLNGPALPEWRPGSVGMPGVPVGMSATQRAFTLWNNEGLGPLEKKARGGGSHGKTDAEREAESYEKITGDLEGQLALLQAQGAEHDRLELKLKIEAEQAKLGKEASREHKDHVADLVTKIDDAEKAQKRLNEAAKSFNEAYKSASGSASTVIKDLLKGKSPGDALQRMLDEGQSNALDAILTGSGPFAKMAGTAGKDGAVGGLFGGIASFFGLQGKAMNAQQMSVNAANVIVNGEGGLGGLGSLLGAGDKDGAGDLFGSIFSAITSLFKFSDGGVMTGAGPLPLKRYAFGGVASSPQFAMFGEGSRPEAYVPLPDGRSIPAVVDLKGLGQESAPRISIQNYAGVNVEPRVTRGEIRLMIREEQNRFAQGLPSMWETYERGLP
jgi:hypothetical protein